MSSTQERQVDLLSAMRGRGAGNEIRVNVVLSYLKDRPIASAVLTPVEALRIAMQLIQLVSVDIREGRI